MPSLILTFQLPRTFLAALAIYESIPIYSPPTSALSSALRRSKQSKQTKRAAQAAKLTAYNFCGKRLKLAPASSATSTTTTSITTIEDLLPETFVVTPLVSPLALPLPVEKVMAIPQGPGSAAAALVSMKQKRN
ncbi:hypothetical protein EDC01DRAFT_789802 [Geopyxis carbonaria]|nr:hypothetical protein EDC01DRAFT_789802 [Geopyxis carbonaria]